MTLLFCEPISSFYTFLKSQKWPSNQDSLYHALPVSHKLRVVYVVSETHAHAGFPWHTQGRPHQPARPHCMLWVMAPLAACVSGSLGHPDTFGNPLKP